jgi:uncharacterized membrane protein YfcA
MHAPSWSDLWALTLFADPATLLAGCVAVTLVGLSKGGLGGAFGLLGVPVLALVMPPVQAAVVGVGLGWLTAAATSDALVRLIVGVVALAFVARSLRPLRAARARGPRPASAWFWGTLAGFTSFVAHAGGPPYQIHTLPLRLDPKVFTGTSVAFFAAVNVMKVLPYAALGQFDARTLTSAALLLPLAVLAVLVGAAVVRRMRPTVFYPFMYAMVALVALRLVYDGWRGLT